MQDHPAAPGKRPFAGRRRQRQAVPVKSGHLHNELLLEANIGHKELLNEELAVGHKGHTTERRCAQQAHFISIRGHSNYKLADARGHQRRFEQW